jgi:hypothetical protein
VEGVWVVNCQLLLFVNLGVCCLLDPVGLIPAF